MADQQSQPNWHEIPDDILFKISSLLTIFSDYIHLRATCHRWRTTLPPTPLHTFPCQLPWLLLPPPPPSSTITTTTSSRRRTIYNILSQKLHSLSVPECSYPRRILGSSHGYLIITSATPEVFCFNPLTNSKVFLSPLSSLPGVVSFSFSNVGREYLVRDQMNGIVYTVSLNQMRDDFFRKIVLSSSPAIVPLTFAFAITTSIVSRSTELVFCTVGEDRWVWIPVMDFGAEDVIYCESKGLFYAVNGTGDVGCFRIGVGGVSEATVWHTVSSIQSDLRYLVLVDEELLLVTRCLSSEVDIRSYCEVYKTDGFEVYRLREDGHELVRWELVKGLGDKVVFVGESGSLALSASDFPGCKGNRIYFTDDHCKCNDVGVFDLGEECIDALPCFPEDASLPLCWEPPIWLTPNPH